jgi:alpha-tubulin suppressor-like RCC1 family protein
LSLYQYRNILYGNIKEAILGDGYTIILNTNGKLYSFGDSYDSNDLNNSTNINNNSNYLINNNNHKLTNIRSIKGKGNINLYLSKSNKLFLNISGKSDFISKINANNCFIQNNPIQMVLSNKIKISSISCGYNFYILLSSEGKLYSGGSNEYGELLSKENNNTPRITPEEIYKITKLNEKIIQVSCGFKHVIILSSSNNVYGWGNNSFGQLFSNNITKKTGLNKLDYFNNRYKIVQVAAGFRCSFIMNENNEIYYYGVLNRKKKNMTGNAQQIFIEEKNNEYGNKSHFVPVKINSTWNKQLSLFYVTFADIRNFSYKIEYSNNKSQNENIKEILKALSSKWLNDSIKVPYIEEINQYIDKNYMEKANRAKKNIFS